MTNILYEQKNIVFVGSVTSESSHLLNAVLRRRAARA
jgi:hypothetical protein